MTRDQLMASLINMPGPWPRPDEDCSLPTDDGLTGKEGWIKGPVSNEWHYAWIGDQGRRIVITREQWEEAVLTHVKRLERLNRQQGDPNAHESVRSVMPECSEMKDTNPKDEVKPSAWNGEGLPPVGSIVTLDSDHGGYAEVRVIGHTLRGGNVVVEGARRGVEVCARSELRPIRSDREKAIGDMKQITKAAADAHKRELHGALSEEYLLGALYDAGHRKVKS